MANKPDLTQEPAAYRTGVTNPLGKLTSEIPKVKVSDSTYEGLRRIGAEAGGLSVREVVRQLCDVRVHGKGHVNRLHAAVTDVVAGKGEE